MKHLFLLLTSWLLGLTTAQAEMRLFNRWTVELLHPQTALERFQEYRVGGLEQSGDSLYLASPYAELERRSLSSGTKVWSVKLDAISQSAWTISGNEIFGGDTKGNIYAINCETGDLKWKATTKGVFFSRPIVSESIVWVMNSLGTLQAYNRADGTWMWQQTDPSIANIGLWSASGFSKIKDQIIAGFPSALLQSVDAQSGKVNWKESFSTLPTGADGINDIKSISLQQDMIFASSFAGNLKAWSLKGNQRKLLWEKQISLYAPVSMDAEGTLYLSGKDGSFQAIAGTNGFQKWKVDLPSGIGTQASLGENHLWLGTSRGEVLVYSKDGLLKAKSNSYESAIWNAPLLLNEREAIVLTTQGILRRVYLSDV